MKKTIAIIDYGMGNLFSIQKKLIRSYTNDTELDCARDRMITIESSHARLKKKHGRKDQTQEKKQEETERERTHKKEKERKKEKIVT